MIKIQHTFYDMHCHLHMAAVVDLKQLIQDAIARGARKFFLNATHQGDWQIVRDFAKKYNTELEGNFVVPSYGFHPWYLKTASEDWLESLKLFLEECKDEEFHIGEIGLDASKHCKDIPMEIQLQFFHAQLKLAAELGKIASVHCVYCQDLMIKELRKTATQNPKILLHSFMGGSKTVHKFTDLGCYFSISPGCCTEKHYHMLSKIPKERLLLESDSPSLFNEGLVKEYAEMEGVQKTAEGKYINEPKFITLVAKKLSQLREETQEAIYEQCLANSEKLLLGGD